MEKMEEEKERDIRVPLISSIFCLLVLTGGIFLVLYVFIPHLSHPWFPIAAFLLIGSPWIFWLFTYIYTCFKPCCLPNRCLEGRLPSQRSHHDPPPAAAALPELTKNPSMEESPLNTPTGERQVHFGGVVVVDNVKGGEQDGNLEGGK